MINWVQGRDLNPRPSGYEPDELPDCSTLHQLRRNLFGISMLGARPFLKKDDRADPPIQTIDVSEKLPPAPRPTR